MAEGKRAISTFATTIDGEEHFVHVGDVLPATHVVVRARPELFETVDERASVPKRRTRTTT
jgi:hypothetical protein